MKNKTIKKGKMFSLIVHPYTLGKSSELEMQRVSDVMKSIKSTYEIIIVADGELGKVKKTFKKKHMPFVKIVGYNTKRGKGYAVRYGMANAKGTIIAFYDIGVGLYPKDIPVLAHIMKVYNADIVVASKFENASIVIYPWQRRLFSWGYRQLIRFLFGLTVRDPQVGFKIFHRKVLENVLPRLMVKQYAFDIEILAVANLLGYRKIYEAPITFTFHNWLSLKTQNFWKAVIHTIWDTCAIFYRLKILNYYDASSSRKWKYDPELNFRINVG